MSDKIQEILEANFTVYIHGSCEDYACAKYNCLKVTYFCYRVVFVIHRFSTYHQ